MTEGDAKGSGTPAEIDDRVHVRRALDGDDAAFAVLVRRYERGIYNVAYRMVRDSELARDLTQDVFIRVHGALGKYDPVYPFTSWIYRVASNLCIDHLRRKKLKTVSLDAPLSLGNDETITRDVEDPRQDPDAELQDRERSRLLVQALDELPEAHRLVLILRHQRDLSYDEIALTLDLPLGTVKARIHRAREALRKVLERRHDLEELL